MTKKQKAILAITLIVLVVIAVVGYIITVNSSSYQLGQLFGTWRAASKNGSQIELTLYKDCSGALIMGEDRYKLTWMRKGEDFTMNFLNDSGAVINECEGIYKNGILTVDIGGTSYTFTHAS